MNLYFVRSQQNGKTIFWCKGSGNSRGRWVKKLTNHCLYLRKGTAERVIEGKGSSYFLIYGLANIELVEVSLKEEKVFNTAVGQWDVTIRPAPCGVQEYRTQLKVVDA